MKPSTDQTAVAEIGSTRVPVFWVLALVPLLLLAGLLLLMLRTGPADALKSPGAPPVERLVVQRAELRPQGIVATVINDGPDSVRIAQVQVDDAYWEFAIDPRPELAHLERASISIPYPWVQGEAHHLRLVTSTGGDLRS